MKMRVSFCLLSFALTLFIHAACGHDITQILNQYPDYSSFNSYLTQTNLAATINARQTITVLVVNNGNISPLSTQSQDTIRNILSVHIILDYYDVTKLQQLTSTSPLLTTLFQSTGLAKGQQGFLSVSHPSPGATAFASAMPGSSQGSSLVKAVTSQPYNISIIEISTLIIPQGIDGSKTSSPSSVTPSAATPPPPPPATAAPSQPTTAPASSPPTTTTTPVTTPASSPPTTTPAATTPASSPPTTTAAPTTTPASSPPTTTAAPTTAPASGPSTKSTAPTTAPASSAPTTATSPSTAVTPSATPGAAPAPGGSTSEPTSEEPAETTPAGENPAGKSAATVVEMGLAVVCATVLSSFYMTSML